jgi:hypothetical protein
MPAPTPADPEPVAPATVEPVAETPKPVSTPKTVADPAFLAGTAMATVTVREACVTQWQKKCAPMTACL